MPQDACTVSGLIGERDQRKRVRQGRLRPYGQYFLIFVLELVELPVETALGEQFLVGTGFAELAFMHYQDHVGALDSRKTMGDEDGSAAGDQAVKCGTDAQFGFCVDGGRGFIEDENARRMGQCAGKIDELLLAGRQAGAALAQGFFITVRQGRDKVGQVDLFRCVL